MALQFPKDDQMKTTLNNISGHPINMEKLLKHLGKTEPDDEELSLLTILQSNGFNDALYCLRSVDGYEREKRLYAVWCARQVERLNPDPRVRKCNDIAEMYAEKRATRKELDEAREAAYKLARGEMDSGRVSALSLEAARKAALAVKRDPSSTGEQETAWIDDREAAWRSAQAAVLEAAREAALASDLAADMGAAREAAQAAERAAAHAGALGALLNGLRESDLEDARRSSSEAVRKAQETEFVRMLHRGY
jgi:hypothetical protein